MAEDRVPTLVAIVGGMAAGKSTVAAGLGARFRAAGREVAVLDLDDVVATIGGFDGLAPAGFRRAVVVWGRLVGAWLEQGVDVIAHGPVFQPDEDAALLHAVPAAVRPRRVLLRTTPAAARERRAADGGPGDDDLLAATYDRIAALSPGLPPQDWTFDTTAVDAVAIVDRLERDLLR